MGFIIDVLLLCEEEEEQTVWRRNHSVRRQVKLVKVKLQRARDWATMRTWRRGRG